MRFHAIVAVASLFACMACGGCSKGGSSKLEGRWKGIRSEGVEPASGGLAFATGTEIVAKGNQITIATPTSKSSATYTVDSEEKAAIVIRTDRDGPLRETFTFTDANTMTWRVDETRSIVFQRMKD